MLVGICFTSFLRGRIEVRNTKQRIEGKNSVAEKIRKKRKEITEEIDNGKREVGNRKHEREDCSENGRRETEEDRRTKEQRNVKKREQTSKETGGTDKQENRGETGEYEKWE